MRVYIAVVNKIHTHRTLTNEWHS